MKQLVWASAMRLGLLGAAIALTAASCGGAPDFSISIDPATLTAPQGNAAEAMVEIEKVNGFDDDAALSIEGDLDGITATFGENPAADASSLTLEVAQDAALGERSLTVEGVAGGVIRTADLRLTVEDPFGGDPVVQIIRSEDPPTDPVQINEHLSVRFVGKGTLVDEEPEESLFLGEDTPGSDPGSEVPVDEAEYGQMAFRVFNPTTGNEFELLFEQPLLDAVHAFQDARGETDATDGVDDPEENERVVAPQGLSNGEDDRFALLSNTKWPWRAVSQFGTQDSNCTGTLIGPRHVITAAHCINRRGTNTWFTIQVNPGRNGLNDTPYGSSTITLNPGPGVEAWYFTPAPWRSLECAGGGYKCPEWDWGMIVIPDRLGDSTGWLGYWAGPASYLNGRTHYNRGYPRCGAFDFARPAECDDDSFGTNFYWARLYGDTQPCDLDSYLEPGPDGWNRVIEHSCDTSPGHSGSSLYHYRFNEARQQWVPVVSMVHHSALCQVCSAGTDHPNRARRITPGDLGIISWLRNVFP